MFHYFTHMLKMSYFTVLTVMLVIGVLTSGQSAFASDSLAATAQKIQALVADKKFNEALSILNQQDDNFNNRALRGRILSWNGDHKEARAVIDSLVSDYPENDDILLASANLEYYQGNLRAAERIYVSVLKRNPDYLDASNGLKNVRMAKKAKRPNKWRFDGGAGQSTFDVSTNSPDVESWNHQSLRIEYTPNTVAFHASAQRFNRFSRTNVQLKAGIASAARGNWDWAAEVGHTPDALFRPETSYGGRIGRKIDLENGPTVVATLHYRKDNYTEAKIHNISPEVTAYFQNGARLTARVIGTVQSEQADQTGVLVSGSYPISNKWRLNAGAAQAPEAVDGIVVTTKSIFGGATYTATPQLDLHINVARDNRENIYVRNSVNVGFTQKF